MQLRSTLRLLVPILLATGAALRAQEFSLLAGGMNTPDASPLHSSYAWQIDYRHGLVQNLELSIAWVNEGHVSGHHRDGNAYELWYRLPFNTNVIRLSLGAGAYYYYDTQPLPPPSTDSLNLHGVAPILSLSAEGAIYDRWFWRIIFNRVNPSAAIKTNTALFGLGYWLGPGPGLPMGNLPGLFEGARAGVGEAKNEFTVFGGWSVVNTLFSQGSAACGAEYRRDLLPNLDATISYFYEGDPHIVRRGGVGLQLWPVAKSFGDHFVVGFGAGTYIYIDRKHQRPGQNAQAAVAGLVSPMVSYRLNDGWFVRLVWNRVITTYSRDSDIWLVGIGYRL